jgi:hypothetical protein
VAAWLAERSRRSFLQALGVSLRTNNAGRGCLIEPAAARFPRSSDEHAAAEQTRPRSRRTSELDVNVAVLERVVGESLALVVLMWAGEHGERSEPRAAGRGRKAALSS